MILPDDVTRALAFVAEFKGDERCSLNCHYAEALAGFVSAQQARTCETCRWGHLRASSSLLMCGLVAQSCGVPLPCSYFGNTCGAFEAKGDQAGER